MNNIQAIEEIVRLTGKRALPMEQVQAKAKLTLAQLQAAIQEGQKRGYSIRVREGMISSAVVVQSEKKIVVGDKKPGRKVIGVWSDTHFGCRHAAEDDMIEHRTRCYEQGCRIMLHSGDLLDGNRPVLLADQDYVGFDSQKARLVRVLRKSPPMIDVQIDGNHDGYYSSAIGSPSGAIVAGQLREMGFDWRFAGVCLGYAEVHGADFHLWHPAGGSTDELGVAKVLRQRLKDINEHVDFLQMGHLHKSVAVSLDGAMCYAPGTYQRKASEFANRISGNWHIGGGLVSFDLDKLGNISGRSYDFFPASAK